MKKKSNENIYKFIFILVLIMVNPPVISMINSYAIKNPLTFGYPTLWVWLQVWYFIGMITFLVGALKLPSWNKREFKEGIR